MSFLKKSIKKIAGGILLLTFVGIIIQPISVHAQATQVVGGAIAAGSLPVTLPAAIASTIIKYGYSKGTGEAIPNNDACLTTLGPIVTGVNLQFCAAEGSNILLQISSWVLWAVALLFNFTLNYSLNFNTLLQGLPIVDEGWAIFRDVANIFFIFVLLFIAITIILDNDKFGGKKLLSTVIITALLLNFSLFFTKAIVDVSNITSLAFYSQMNGSSGTDGQWQVDGIAATLMKGLGLQTVFQSDLLNTSSSIGTGAASSGKLSESTQKILGNSGTGATKLDLGTIIVIGLAGSALILVTSFVLLAAIALFMIRTVILILLMMLSPLAFVAQAIPGAQGYSKTWWDALFKQCLFAPVYMAMMYVVIKVVGDPQKFNGGGSFTALFVGDGTAISAVFTFGLLISLLVAVLLVAQKIGAVGAKTAMSAGKGISSYVAARGIGGAAYKLANSEGFKNTIGRSRFATNLVRSVSKADFGGKSYEDMIKNQEKKEKSHQEYLGAGAKLSMRTGETASAFATRQKEANLLGRDRVDNYVGITRERTVDAQGKVTRGNITAMKEGRWTDMVNAGGKIAFKKTQGDFVKKDLEKQKKVDDVKEEVVKAKKVVEEGEKQDKYKEARQQVVLTQDALHNKNTHPELQEAQNRIAKAQDRLKELREHQDIKDAENEVTSANAAANSTNLNEYQKFLTKTKLDKANQKLKETKEKIDSELKTAEQGLVKEQENFAKVETKVTGQLNQNIRNAEGNLENVEKELMGSARKTISDEQKNIKAIKDGDPVVDKLKALVEGDDKPKDDAPAPAPKK